MSRATKKVEQALIKEQNRQLKIINITSFVALHEMGWDADQIIDTFNLATDAWNECREQKLSIFQLLEKETGIEMALDGEKSYHEFDQLNNRYREVTEAEYIYGMHRRKRWIPPMLLACAVLGLSRRGISDAELNEFISRTDEIRKQYGDRVDDYEKMMEERTGFTPKVWE